MELLINIDVDDLEKAIEFYRRAVGLRLSQRLFDDSVAEMLGAPVPIYLLAKDPGSVPSSRTSQVRHYQRHWTPVHLDFVVDNVDAATEVAVAAGATLENNPQSFVWGRQALLSDPFGNGFCFVQWFGRGYDAVTFSP